MKIKSKRNWRVIRAASGAVGFECLIADYSASIPVHYLYKIKETCAKKDVDHEILISTFIEAQLFRLSLISMY